MRNIWTVIVICFVLLCVITMLSTGVLSFKKKKPTEKYEDNPEEPEDDGENDDAEDEEDEEDDENDAQMNWGDVEASTDDVIISDRIFYFKLGLANFFAQHQTLPRKTNSEFMSWISENSKVFVWPNYQDICCKSLEHENKEKLKCSCDNIHIGFSSFQDKSTRIYNEKRIPSIESSIGAPQLRNCTMTILNSDYHLLKRTYLFNIPEPIVQEGSNKSPIYRVPLQGSITSLVLSRPLFVSFNMAGLYMVVHEDFENQTVLNNNEDKKESNAFAYFNSTKTDKNFIHLKPIPSEFEGKMIFPPTKKNIRENYSPDRLQYPGTLYYFNFKSELKMYDADIHVLNLMIDEKLYNEEFATNNRIEIGTAQDHTNYIQHILLTKDDDNILKLNLDGQIFEIPSDFLYHDPQKFMHFNICFTISHDILIITCFGAERIADKSAQMSVCFQVRRHISNKVFQMRKQRLMDTLTSRSPNMLHLINGRLREAMTISSIPNYALLAYNLGYTFAFSNI